MYFIDIRINILTSIIYICIYIHVYLWEIAISNEANAGDYTYDVLNEIAYMCIYMLLFYELFVISLYFLVGNHSRVTQREANTFTKQILILFCLLMMLRWPSVEHMAANSFIH